MNTAEYLRYIVSEIHRTVAATTEAVLKAIEA